MKLYGVSGGPPSLAVRMALKSLDIPYDYIEVDFCGSAHMTDDYAKMNPQKEIPVLEDNGFFLSESIAIMQYLCDKYKPNCSLYPFEPTTRAVINQRLCFNMGFYYNYINKFSMDPVFYDYPRTPEVLQKVKIPLNAFEAYLKTMDTKFAAGNSLTIADFPLICATTCLEAVDFDFSEYVLVTKWYNSFKREHPDLWAIAEIGLLALKAFAQNPPDLSHMKHPIHPVRKAGKI